MSCDQRAFPLLQLTLYSKKHTEHSEPESINSRKAGIGWKISKGCSAHSTERLSNCCCFEIRLLLEEPHEEKDLQQAYTVLITSVFAGLSAKLKCFPNLSFSAAPPYLVAALAVIIIYIYTHTHVYI